MEILDIDILELPCEESRKNIMCPNFSCVITIGVGSMFQPFLFTTCDDSQERFGQIFIVLDAEYTLRDVSGTMNHKKTFYVKYVPECVLF